MAICVATCRFWAAASSGCRELTSSSALEIRLSIRSSAFTPSPLRPETSTYGRLRSSSDSGMPRSAQRSEEHTSELQSLRDLVCRLLLEKKKKTTSIQTKTETQQDERSDTKYRAQR